MLEDESKSGDERGATAPRLPDLPPNVGEDEGTDSGQATVPGGDLEPGKGRPRKRRRWLWLVGAAVLSLALVVVVGLFAWSTINRSEARAGAISFLRYNGLDRLLTDQDDPRLWAAAIKTHGLPDCFGVGIEDGADEQIGMVELETACFGWAGEKRTVSHDPKQACPQKQDCLYISRPSAGIRHALVYNADSYAGTFGGLMLGRTMVWFRHPDGGWHETETEVAAWGIQWDY